MTIISAAVQYKGLILILPPPHRHHHILHMMDDLGWKTYPASSRLQYLGRENQGFLTSKGKYVDRELAGKIAIADGQITHLRWPPSLFSEDLW